MRVEPRSLVRRLTPTATKLLEQAVGRAGSTQAYEVTIEHYLAVMLEDAEGEASKIIHAFKQDRVSLIRRVQRNLELMRSGNAGRPTLSPKLLDWMQDAWVLASLEHGHVKLRTGVLFEQLAASPDDYIGDGYAELENIPSNELKRDFDKVVGSSPEALESQPADGSGGGGATPGKGTGAEGEALKRFCTNFTEKARKGEIDPIFGRHAEIRQLIDVLARRRKNNPIVVGEPGVGKTALVEGLALAIVAGEVPDQLKGVELLGLDLGLLQAGASVKGEFENRLKAVISETKASAKPIVLFIDEAHTLIGAGGSAGTSDAANLLKPALARGELRTIAATTWAEYKKYFEKDAALERRFQPVKVEEPSTEIAIGMLRGVRPIFEKAHGITIRDEAVVAAVELSQRYISGRLLPDKAVDLLDTSAARVVLARKTKPEALVALEAEAASLAREHTALTRDRDDGHPVDTDRVAANEARTKAVADKIAVVQPRWDAELAAVRTVDEARVALNAAKGDAEVAAAKAALEAALAARKKIDSDESMVPAEVDRAAVAQVVASWTGIPAGKMKSDAIQAVLQLENRLRDRVVGQEHALKTVAEVIRIANAGVRNPSTPVGVLLFVGPSGVGKTETATALADTLYGGERFMTTINMSEFQEKHSVSRLIGSPPGYVGYGEGGILTEAVRQRPYSVVLLDEVEKADLEVMNLFYQVFDKGTLSDSEGRIVDFKNTIVILTSNLATDLVMKAYEADEPPPVEQVVEQIRPALSKHFKPALLARMTIVPFAPIGGSTMRLIAEMKLRSVAKRLYENHKIEATFAPELLDEIVRQSTAAEVGGRNVEHVLRGAILPAISRQLLEIMAGGTTPKKVVIGLSPRGEYQVDFS